LAVVVAVVATSHQQDDCNGLRFSDFSIDDAKPLVLHAYPDNFLVVVIVDDDDDEHI
jgi:hypothetical protein